MIEKEFQEYIATTYEHAAITMAMGLGHNLGLFKLLLEADQPMSMKEIAEKLDFKERYTLEWLSCMVAASIIHQDRETSLYHIPESHRATLRNRVAFAPILFPLCGRVPKLSSCFKKDGPYGIGFDESPEWFNWFDGYRGGMTEFALETEILPRLEEQGLFPRLESGIKVMDLGSGTGSYTLGLAKRFPNSHFTGVEYALRGLELAKEKCKSMGLTNATFEYGDAHDLSDKWANHFDWVFVYDTLHDLPDPPKALTQIHKVMKDDARFSLIEVGFHSDPRDNAGNSKAAMYYGFSMFVCLTSSMTQPPHKGYGACWGVEAIEKELVQQKFKIEKQSSLDVLGKKAFFFCSK